MSKPVKHSRLGASSAHRWMACPRSVKLSWGIKDKTSVYAEEGTAAHTLAERCLTQSKAPEEYRGRWINGFEVRDEMIEAVGLYLVEVNRQLTRTGGECAVERRFDLKDIHKAMFGTNDCSILTPDDTLIVYDFKYGKGHAVEVEGNVQLQFYALGAVYEYRKAGREVKHIELVIVQPRCPHEDGVVRRAHMTVEALNEFARELAIAAKRTEDRNAPLVTGDHCRFCPALTVCPETRKQAMATAQMDFSPVSQAMPPEPSLMTLDELAVLLPKLELMQTWAKAVMGHAFMAADSGMKIPGYKLVRKRANRKWKSEQRVEAICTHLLGFTGAQIYDKKMKSPAQLLKQVEKDQREHFDALIIKESSGLTLVPDTDSRPAAPPSVETDFAASLLE